MLAALFLPALLCGLSAGGWGVPWADARERALLAVPSALAFALAAWLLRGVDASGAVAGFAVALTLWLAAGWQAFVTLLAVFCLTWAATRVGYARKQQLGTAERRGGRRDAAQVLANTGAAALLAMFSPAGWVVGAVAVLCEAAADTVSSEVGQALSRRPRLITSSLVVEPGTNGAVSLAGTLAGVLGAALIAATALAVHLLSQPWQACLAAAAGIAGMLIDSLLGATLERRGVLGNDGVNAASTIASALLAWLPVSILP